MRWHRAFLWAGSLLALAAWAQAPGFQNVGRTPTPAEIGDWDISVGPSGKELPPGSGKPADGAAIYAAQCAGCHGANLEGGGGGPALMGGEGTMTSLRIRRTIGSYWGFATTVYDFINRAMPPNRRGSLTPDEIYAVTAFLLYRNNIIKEGDVMDATSLPKIRMPNRENFIPLNPVWDPKAVRPHGVYP